MLPYLYEEYVKNGKVQIVFLDFPLSMHHRAFEAARAAQCAGEQDQFWDYHHQIFGASFGELSAEELVDHAEFLGLDVEAFKSCFESQRHAAGIRDDVRQVKMTGITGTPAFLIGRRIPETSKVQVEEIVRGAVPFEQLAKIIDGLFEKP